ncbi:mitochondrial respiratory chain complex I assembly [Teratosphaeria destructans]|uniref:Mitochondrial respiratory chain complex I assembly n=1 Tax=Teratosphaeria destructans TaxID=418781 RepID=A0A9W7W0F6_9PEZI|nr:mitochondrial respiratory chain complex I assembly [Teratosphaeria destructans]
MPTRTRPIEKFAAATAKCTTEGAVYGKCVAAHYQNARKDMCAEEFLRLKDCYIVAPPPPPPPLSPSTWFLIFPLIESRGQEIIKNADAINHVICK